MPLRGRLQSLFEEIDAKVDAKLGLSGNQGYLNQNATPYGAPNAQYGHSTYGQPGAQNGWPQQQNAFGGPSDQWHTAQQSGQLAVPQQKGRPRGNSNPAARERENDGIPFDAPPAYEDASHSSTKQPIRPSPSSQYGNPPVESLPPRMADHWAPTNPFNNARVAGGYPPQQYTQQPPNLPAQQRQGPPQQNSSGIQPMFPPQFEMWFNTSSKSSKTELAIAGQPPNNPDYVATLSLGWKAKMELHQGGVGGPVIASGKSSNLDGTKQGLIFPDGSTVEVKTPDLSKFYFTIPMGPQGSPEKFRWKKSRGGDMREVSPIYSGWKLTRESDGEVMAVFGEKVGFKNGAGGGTFAFAGAARSGALGGHFANVAVISFIKVTHTSFVSSIVSSAVGSV